MAIVACFISVWSNVRLGRLDCPPFMRRLGFGLLLGSGAVAMMLLPFEVESGVRIDLRTTMIAISGFFGGPLSVAVTALMAAVFRISIGGLGMTAGLTGIAVAATTGIAAFAMKRRERPSFAAMMYFSAAVAAGCIASFAALPRTAWGAIGLNVLVPAATIVFSATLMACLAIANELRRREASQKNHIYKVVIDSLPDCLNVKDRDGNFIFANPATARLMQAADAEALIGKSDFDFYPAEIAWRFKADEDQVLRGGAPTVVVQRVAHSDGSGGWLSTLKAPLVDEAGRVTGLITHNRDITIKKQLEEALADSERKATAALTNMADGLAMFDAELNMVFCNEQYRGMFPLTADLRRPGVPAAAILHASIARGELINIPQDGADDWVNAAVSRLRLPGVVQFPLYDGRWIESRTNPAADGTCFVVCSDITKTKQDAQVLRDLNARLAELADTDGLTGLLNRRAFDALLAQEIARVGRGEGALSLLLLDVDRFKAFNDTYGHTLGDDCLRSIAACLRSVAADNAARYGGEEMVLVLPNTAEDGAMEMAQALRERIRALKIAHIGSEKGIVTASIGVATLANHTVGVDANALVMHADEALYAAKAAGRDLVRAWTPAMLRGIAARAG